MQKFWDFILKIEKFVMAIGMFIMVILNFLNVLFRNLLPQTPFSYSEELTIITFVWVLMFGISYGFKVHAHTISDVFTKMLPKKLEPIIIFLVTVTSVLFMTQLLYTSYLTMINQIRFGQVTPGMRLPMAVNSGALMIGSFISALSVLRAGYLEYKEYKLTSKEVIK